MKTYNTIEDILNDHELMENDLKNISMAMYSLPTKEFLKIPHKGQHLPKVMWLISEYERRKKEKSQLANATILTQSKPMEKKNLIPFDLEKAKAGAKVWYRQHPAQIVFENEKEILIVFKIDGKSDHSTWYDKGKYGDFLFIESEPLPEMWVNVYKEDDFYCGIIHKTKEKALMGKSVFYIGTAKLVFE